MRSKRYRYAVALAVTDNGRIHATISTTCNGRLDPRLLVQTYQDWAEFFAITTRPSNLLLSHVDTWRVSAQQLLETRAASGTIRKERIK